MVDSGRRSNGFSLVEVLITLALVTILSVVALNVLTPWLMFKQVLDTDRKLQDMRKALTSVYETNAMAVEAQASNKFMGLTSDTASAGSACTSQASALTALGPYLTESSLTAANDGFQAPLCFLIAAAPPKDVEGVRLYYRTVAIVSTGQSGTLDPATKLDASTGQLTLGGDNRGVVVNGYSIQYAKYRDSLERMNRLASLYEGYFTTRFLNTADRDVSRNYFYNSPGQGGDPSGTVAPTVGWTPVLLSFGASLGASPLDATSLYESNNTIEVGNYDQAVDVNGVTTTVRSPATLGTGATPPYTALLRTRLPGAPTNFIVRAVVGNY